MRLKTSMFSRNTSLPQDLERDINALGGTMREKPTLQVVDSKSLQSDMLPFGDPASSGFTKRRGLSWITFAILSVLCVLASPVRPSNIWSPASHLDVSRVDIPTGMNLSGNGRTTDVLWDKYSLVIKGQRIFIQ